VPKDATTEVGAGVNVVDSCAPLDAEAGVFTPLPGCTVALASLPASEASELDGVVRWVFVTTAFPGLEELKYRPPLPEFEEKNDEYVLLELGNVDNKRRGRKFMVPKWATMTVRG
jgi:hypothetical protein